MIVDNGGRCYFANEFDGLTRFDPDTETFEDLPLTIPVGGIVVLSTCRTPCMMQGYSRGMVSPMSGLGMPAPPPAVPTAPAK